MRIWLLEQVDTLSALLKDLLKVTVARASSEIDHIMPGYTHLQVRVIGSLMNVNYCVLTSALAIPSLRKSAPNLSDGRTSFYPTAASSSVTSSVCRICVHESLSFR